MLSPAAAAAKGETAEHFDHGDGDAKTTNPVRYLVFTSGTFHDGKNTSKK
jgi:hypothetical protein